MNTKRTFIALEIPKTIQTQCASVIQSITETLPPSSKKKVRWVNPDRIHLTLRFIGETDPALIPTLSNELDQGCSSAPHFNLTLQNLGVFPGWKSPRVLWLALDIPQTLLDLQSDLETRIQTLGFKPETRKFAPHLTLGRIQRKTDEPTLKMIEKLKNHPLPKFESAKIDTITLFESKLSRKGPVYLPLHAVKLGKFFNRKG